MATETKSIFVYPLVVMAVLGIIALVVLELILESWFFDRSELELNRVITATADSIEQIDATESEMQIIAESVGQVSTNNRITLIKSDGVVMGDSTLTEQQVANAKNLLDRQEVKQALKDNYGKVVRFSVSSQSEMLFIAKPFRRNELAGVIRVAMPMEALNIAIFQLRTILISIGVVAFCALGFFIIMYMRHFNNAVKQERELLETRVEERTQDIEILQRFASMLAACNSMSEVQNVVKDIVPRILGDNAGSISLFNSSRNLVEQKIQWPNEWPGEKIFAPEDCWALRKGKYHISKDKFSELKCQHMHESDIRTLCIPLLAQGNSIGLVHINVEDECSDHFLNIAFTLAEHLGLTLANIILQDKLREQAVRDPLTRLYNRRYMEEAMDTEINRCRRYKSQFALLMMDIDHFKLFNDNFGHDAGDYVLKQLGRILVSSVRAEDIVCRVGGEELAIIVPESNIDDASMMASKICKLVRDSELSFNGISLGQLTISIGISVFNVHGLDMSSLMKAADVALYKSKENGRDQYTVAEGQNLSPVAVELNS